LYIQAFRKQGDHVDWRYKDIEHSYAGDNYNEVKQNSHYVEKKAFSLSGLMEPRLVRVIELTIKINVLAPLKFQNFEIEMIIRARFCVNGKVFLADPTPLMFANLAYHVRATALFLYFDSAIHTLPHIL
jgi:hypothetical protein